MKRLFSRRPKEAEIDEEIQSHLRMAIQDRVERGESPQQARTSALRELGNARLVKEDTRAVWVWTALERLGQDLKYALRQMRHSPGFTAVAVLSLALGIGGTTAVFSVFDAAVLRPMSVREPERLVIVRPTLRGERFVLFNPFFEELRLRQTTLEHMFAVQDGAYWKATFEGETAPTYVRGSKVSGNYFSTLGLSPALGRLLEEADDNILGTPESSGCAAILSHAAWTQRFQQDRGVLGRRVLIGETDCSIVGVAPAGFQSVQPGFSPEVWAPMRTLTEPRMLEHRTLAFFSGIMGRLRDGVAINQAEAELTLIYQQILSAEPPRSAERDERRTMPTEFAIQLLPGGHGLDDLGRSYGRPLALVLAVVGVVL